MFCHKCGNLVSDEAKFCSHCGEKIFVQTLDESLKAEITDSVKLIVTSNGVDNEIFSDMKFDISVDGVQMGSVPGKGTIEYEITPGHHCIKIGVANIVINIPTDNASVTLIFIWGPSVEQRIICQQDHCISSFSNSTMVQDESNKKLKSFFGGLASITTICIVIIIAVVAINTKNSRHRNDVLSVANYSQDLNFNESDTNVIEDVSGQNSVGMNDEVRKAYAQKVQELEAQKMQSTDLLFDLIDLDGNDVLELVADERGHEVSVFTWVDGNLITLMDKLAYGVGGNLGYNYLPGHNVIYNFNLDDRGAVQCLTYWAVNRYYEVSELLGETLYICYFNDINRNKKKDENEEYCDEPFYYYGDKEITEEEYATYQIEGDYEYMMGDKTTEEILKLLNVEN